MEKNIIFQKPVSDEAPQARVDAMYALVHEETEPQWQRSERQVFEKLLEVKNICVVYDTVCAIKNLSLHVEPGEIVSLLGSNGAGKSSLLKSVLGMVKLQQGDIEFQSKKISGMDPHQIVSTGIGFSPEGRQVFADMTVFENLKLGAYYRSWNSKKIKDRMQEIFSIFPILKDRIKQQAVTLSGGEQQMLAIGRALMGSPKLLLLDEPSLGISPLFCQNLFSLLKKINQNGTSILLAEQNASQALKISHRSYILELGEVTLQGDSAFLADHDQVRKSYLGG
jgi:branched-chain amino acid transport system ATP-binding protein